MFEREKEVRKGKISGKIALASISGIAIIILIS
jgi:hypothetical protein